MTSPRATSLRLPGAETPNFKVGHGHVHFAANQALKARGESARPARLMHNQARAETPRHQQHSIRRPFTPASDAPAASSSASHIHGPFPRAGWAWEETFL